MARDDATMPRHAAIAAPTKRMQRMRRIGAVVEVLVVFISLVRFYGTAGEKIKQNQSALGLNRYGFSSSTAICCGVA